MNDIDQAYADWDADERRKRNAVIEECAQLLDELAKNQWDSYAQDALRNAAAAIRALKDKP